MRKNSQKPTFEYERKLEKGSRLVAGVDEVGRGCIAGPLVAGAVIFSNYDEIECQLKEVNDSKKLSEIKRIELDKLIRNMALDFSIGVATVAEIDALGIGAANVLAFKRALDSLTKCDFALIDGRKFNGFTYEYLCLERGDSKSISIAAASIIAKVYRDNLMCNLTSNDLYDFGHNKGYGSKKHYTALKKFGPTENHRKTFLKFLFSNQTSLF